MEWITDLGDEVLAFRRGEVVVVVNLGATDLSLPPALTSGRQTVLASSSISSDHPQHGGVVAPDSCVWLAP